MRRARTTSRKAADAAAGIAPAEDPTRYIFPSVDGGEMVSRWDMHTAPPDILVTNASMLGTMLSREVEERMFEQTRDWLLSDDKAYFYLVIDELHLVRGSAGTEVSFLIKSLLQRLGLDDPAHMHKLRILASSASLPLDEARAPQSLRYLRDLFAPFGTCANAGDRGTTETEFWRGCVVPGEANMLAMGRTAPAARTLRAPARDVRSGRTRVRGEDRADRTMSDRRSPTFWPTLGIACDAPDRVVQAAVRRPPRSDRVLHERRRRPRHLGRRHRRPPVRRQDADRALFAGSCWCALCRRAASHEFKAKLPEGVPSFRFHGFIRNVEGLFGSVRAVRGRNRDRRSDDGARRFARRAGRGRARGRRLFELLYCEACGELLIGGQRGDKNSGAVVEMLPSAADLENIPEKGVSEYYDKMLFDQFAVFWPRTRRSGRAPRRGSTPGSRHRSIPNTGASRRSASDVAARATSAATSTSRPTTR